MYMCDNLKSMKPENNILSCTTLLCLSHTHGYIMASMTDLALSDDRFFSGCTPHISVSFKSTKKCSDNQLFKVMGYTLRNTLPLKCLPFFLKKRKQWFCDILRKMSAFRCCSPKVFCILPFFLCIFWFFSTVALIVLFDCLNFIC